MYSHYFDAYLKAIESTGCPTPTARQAAMILSREALTGKLERTDEEMAIVWEAWQYTTVKTPTSQEVA